MTRAQRCIYGLAWLVLLVACLPSMVACQSLGLTAPQTPSQKLYAGIGTAAQAQALATNLLQAKMISSSKAQEVQDASRGVKKVIDEYFKLGTVDDKPMTAVEVLTLVNKSLLALETFLAEKK